MSDSDRPLPDGTPVAPPDELAARRRSGGPPQAVSLANPAPDDLDARLAALRGDDGIGDRVLSQLAPVRPMATLVLRVLLGVASGMQVIVSIPWLFGQNPLEWLLGKASGQHLTRDGALGLVIGFAGALSVWRPRYALAMLMLCGGVVGLQVIAGMVDGSGDDVSANFETIHTTGLVVVALVAVVALGRERPPGPTFTR